MVERKLSALERQAANALLRARRLPIGADRNDLRQLARGAALAAPKRHGRLDETARAVNSARDRLDFNDAAQRMAPARKSCGHSRREISLIT
jgi:hypothetical protein